MKKEIRVAIISSFLFGMVIGFVTTTSYYKKQIQSQSQITKQTQKSIQQNANMPQNLPPGHPDISIDYEKEIQTKLNQLEKSPNDINLIIDLAFLYEQTRKYNEALNLYEKALQINDKNIDALNGAATIYRLNNEIDKAKVFYQKVIEISKYDPNALLELGWIALYIENNPKKAANIWQSLIDNNPDFIYKDLLQNEIDKIKKKDN